MFKSKWFWALLLVVFVAGVAIILPFLSVRIIPGRAIEIEGATASLEKMENILVVSGNYLYQKSNIISRVSGNVGFLKEGQFNPGDLLVRIDSEEFKNQLASLNNKIKQSLINIERMNDRITSSVREVDLAKMSLEGNQETLNTLMNKLEGLKMVAPYDGVVYESKYQKGDLAVISVPAISLYRYGSLYALINIPEKDKALISKATSVKLTFSLQPDTVYSGTIQEIGTLVELDKLGQRVVKVKIKPSTKIEFPINSSVQVHFQDGEINKVYNGYLDSNEKVTYTPRLSGEVIFIETPGRRVARGALLIQLRSEELENQIEQQKRTIKQLEANLKKAEEAVKSLKQELEILNLQYKDLLIQAQNLTSQKQNYEIKAGSEGRVLQKNVEIGDSLTPGQILMIVEKGKPYVRGYLGEEEFTRVSKGMKARVTFLEQIFNGVVTEISSIAQIGRDGSNVYYIKIEIDQPVNIPDNAGVEINIILDEKEKVLTIPSEALIFKNNEEYVFTFTPTQGGLGKVSLIKVKTGWETAGKVEILEGLRVGDIVIINPPEILKEGMLVRMKTL